MAASQEKEDNRNNRRLAQNSHRHNASSKRLPLGKFFVRFKKWAKGIWLAIKGQQIMPTQREDWSNWKLEPKGYQSYLSADDRKPIP